MQKRTNVNWNEISERLRQAQISAHSDELDASKQARMLRERAELLAEPARRERSSYSSEMVMIFRIGSDRFAVPLADLVEVVLQPELAFVPGAAAEVAGLIQVRGEVRPVYRLPKLLGLAQNAEEASAAVLLLEGKAGQFGIGVDTVEDVCAAPEHTRRAGALRQGYAGWMTEDLAPVLSVNTLLERADDGKR